MLWEEFYLWHQAKGIGCLEEWTKEQGCEEDDALRKAIKEKSGSGEGHHIRGDRKNWDSALGRQKKKAQGNYGPTSLGSIAMLVHNLVLDSRVL